MPEWSPADQLAHNIERTVGLQPAPAGPLEPQTSSAAHDPAQILLQYARVLGPSQTVDMLRSFDLAGLQPNPQASALGAEAQLRPSDASDALAPRAAKRKRADPRTELKPVERECAEPAGADQAAGEPIHNSTSVLSFTSLAQSYSEAIRGSSSNAAYSWATLSTVAESGASYQA